MLRRSQRSLQAYPPASLHQGEPSPPPNRRFWQGSLPPWMALLILLPLLSACGNDGGDAAKAEQGRAGGASGPPKGAQASGHSPEGGPPSNRNSDRPGSGRPGAAGGANERGVPVELATLERRDMAAYFETQGTLEAENEVDLVARVSGPIVRLLSEEGRQVKRGELLAQIDDRELAAQLQVAKVRLQETEQSYQRVRSLHDSQLLSQEALDQSLASYQTAQGEHQRLSLQLDYTRITAPFSGLVVERYIKLAEQVNVGSELFRLSDFDPLLCRIQVPERELRRLHPGQRAELTVEAWGDRRFDARVQLVAPVVEAASGTVRVTLEVDGTDESGQRLLQPGMFASVYLEMETRPQALVLPRRALALDSLEDSVFVAADGIARRRTVELGIRNAEFLEVLSGVEAGEQVVVVGLDGLSDGTPVDVGGGLEGQSSSGTVSPGAETAPAAAPEGGVDPAADGASRRGRPADGPEAIDLSDPQQVDELKARMRQRGLSESEIQERLERLQQRQSGAQ